VRQAPGNGALIVAFSLTKQHLAIAFASEAVARFAMLVTERDYTIGGRFTRLPWPVRLGLLRIVIDFGPVFGADVETFLGAGADVPAGANSGLNWQCWQPA